MPSPNLVIQIGPQAHPLERRAAAELRRYVRQLFGFTPTIRSTLPTRGAVLCLGTPSTNPQLEGRRILNAESFVVQPRRGDRPRRCDVIGGSPCAVQWAVYAVVEQWGVHYLVHGDVMPDRAGPFRLPARSIRATPVFSRRCYRLVNDMINSSALWSLAEHEKLLDQLAKLRFNSVYAATNPSQPWAHWSYRGIERNEADICYGFRHPIHERSIGRDVLGIGHYTNPDLRNCETYEQRLDAGRRFMHGLIAAAHERGLAFGFNHNLTQLPEQMKRHLGTWSKGIRIPKAEATPTHPHSLGLERDGGEMRFGHLMTPLNPAYVDAIESWLSVHLAEYAEMDCIVLHQQEFPPSAAGLRKCWDQLDRRHDLSRHISLEKILQRGRRLHFHSPGRGMLQTQGAIIMLRLLDLVINEHQIIDEHLPPQSKIWVRFMSHLVAPLVPLVFDPQRVEFIATVDYTASDVARRIDTLSFARTSRMKVQIVVSPEDDNVGFLPQLTTPPLQTIVEGMKAHGLTGYTFRHWLVSKLEPSMGYLIDAAWDRSATAAGSMRRQVTRVCGRKAVQPMMKAFTILAAALDDANATVGIAFLMPSLLQSRWDNPLGPPQARAVQRVIGEYEKVLTALREGLEKTEPRGRPYARNLVAYVDFGCRYLEVVQQITAARSCYDKATAERHKGNVFDIDMFDRLLIESADRLDGAVTMLEDAMEIWRADGICDPSDRGTLAGLNAYGLDYLRGRARQARLLSEQTAALKL